MVSRCKNWLQFLLQAYFQGLEQLDSHLTVIHVILYLSIFRKSVEKIQFLLKSDKNNGYFT